MAYSRDDLLYLFEDTRWYVFAEVNIADFGGEGRMQLFDGKFAFFLVRHLSYETLNTD